MSDEQEKDKLIRAGRGGLAIRSTPFLRRTLDALDRENASDRQSADKNEKVLPLDSIDMDSENASYYYDLGLSLSEQEEYAEAEIEFRKAIKLDPDRGEYLNELGWALLWQDKYAKAVEAF